MDTRYIVKVVIVKERRGEKPKPVRVVDDVEMSVSEEAACMLRENEQAASEHERYFRLVAHRALGPLEMLPAKIAKTISNDLLKK